MSTPCKVFVRGVVLKKGDALWLNKKCRHKLLEVPLVQDTFDHDKG